MKSVKDYYQKRFSKKDNERRKKIWKTLNDVFYQRYIRQRDAVMDIGAGYCEFINQIKCGMKVAVDINPETKKWAAKEVKIFIGEAQRIPKKYDGKFDAIFLSNVLEHLHSKNDVIVVLEKANSLLKIGGKILISQPNINLIKEHYWDFIDHEIPINEKNLREILILTGFEVKQIIKRFLPYTTKSWMGAFANSFFIRVYLFIPQAIRPFAGQSFFYSVKKS